MKQPTALPPGCGFLLCRAGFPGWWPSNSLTASASGKPFSVTAPLERSLGSDRYLPRHLEIEGSRCGGGVINDRRSLFEPLNRSGRLPAHACQDVPGSRRSCKQIPCRRADLLSAQGRQSGACLHLQDGVGLDFTEPWDSWQLPDVAVAASAAARNQAMNWGRKWVFFFDQVPQQTQQDVVRSSALA